MAGNAPFFWKKAPFIKLLAGLIAGILVQWELQVPVKIWRIVLPASILVLVAFFFIPFFNRFRFLFISGAATTCIFLSVGALLAWHKDIRNQSGWFGHFYKEKDALIVTLDEDPVEKTRTFKANTTAGYVLHNERFIPVTGKLILYIKKDSLQRQLTQGTKLIFKKPIREINNTGNPGGFDYKRHVLFQGITHQVFLNSDEFELLEGTHEGMMREFINNSRQTVVNILRKNIPGEKEKGLAEALLIGYKDDLDKRLVQSYTNTGVVHIIAISGLHLGMIYGLLVLLLRPVKARTKKKWLVPMLIIVSLWLFSLLAGARPSILRSALMFTCIVTGESLARKVSVFNTMALSAFILLCINPYWLWDVGFQLSYAAVLSIIIFMRPIYNWFFIKNKILDYIWKLNAVTLSAQVLTIPVAVYHFHQFPNYFLLTNLLAVPLSAMILTGEIFVCLVAWIPSISLLAGQAISLLIGVMNTWIEKIESMRFSLWENLQIHIIQEIMLILFAAGIATWLMEKIKRGLVIGLGGLLGFIGFRSSSFVLADRQKKIIVYNVPQRRAVDFIQGRKCYFMGDPSLVADEVIRNFHLKPARILYRVIPSDSLNNFQQTNNLVQFFNTKILMLDSFVQFLPAKNKPGIDLLIISKNPGIYIKDLAAALQIKQVVFDASVPSWKTSYWKKDCDSLHIPWHDVTSMGAFVMKVN